MGRNIEKGTGRVRHASRIWVDGAAWRWSFAGDFGVFEIVCFWISRSCHVSVISAQLNIDILIRLIWVNGL